MAHVSSEMTRRGFIITTAAAGGGLILGWSSAAIGRVNRDPSLSPTPKAGGVEIDHWVMIDPEGFVTVVQPHAEMGQGAFTSVAMMLNEELHADWDMIRVQYAGFNRHINNKDPRYPDAEGLWNTMSSGGSNVVKRRHPHIMQAGASVRERLKEAAAQAWGVARDQVTTKDSVLSSGNNRGTYAEFAAAAAQITLAEEPGYKSPDEWTFLGTDVPRVDIPLKVNGEAMYAADVRLPGMVYAAVVNNPVQWGGKPTYDASGILDRPGIIKVIEMSLPGEREEGKGNRGFHDMAMKNSLAVVADSYYRAKTALELIPIQWDYGPDANVSNDSLYAAATAKLGDHDGRDRGMEGDALGAIAAAPSSSVITADYTRPYESHLRPEPIVHVAQLKDGRYDAWIGAQHPPRVAVQIADQLGMENKDIHLHRTFLAGGFSSSSGTYIARQAAEIARQLNGTPVQVRYSREEDTSHGTLRTLGAIRLTAALGSDGLPTAISSVVVSDGSQRIANQFNNYNIPNRHYVSHNLEGHIATTSHRNPTGGFGGFVNESFVDEMALAAGWDPLEWRIHMSKDHADWQLVLNTLKDKAGFRTDLPKGYGMGVACVDSHGTLTGQCVTLSVARRGQVRIEKVLTILDPGHVIDPMVGIEQAEGSVVWGISHSLMGGIEVQNGRVVNSNFDKMHILRIGDMPEMETHYALSRGEKWGGLGEPAVSAVQPAIANAIFFATGKRVRTGPMMQQDLSWS